MITENAYIARWSFLWHSLARGSWWFSNEDRPQSVYYRPLQDIWLGLNYHLFGANPFGWHVLTIGLHLLTTWLVFKLARALLGSGVTALIAALLFGLLPFHADAVIWPAAVPLPMSAALELGAFYLFAERGNARTLKWTLALLCYASALLSHESAVAFPGLIAAYVYLLEPPADGAKPRLQRVTIETAPFALVMIAYLAVRRAVMGFTLNSPAALHFANTAPVLATVPWAWFHFVEITLLPWLAGPAHQVSPVRDMTEAEFVVPFVIFAGMAMVLIFGRFAKRRLYLFCALWFAIPLIPEIALIAPRSEAFVQDRYLYLASFGWCLFVADALGTLAATKESTRIAILSGVALLAGFYAITLFRVQRFWHDNIAYFTECVTECPESPFYHTNLGIALETAGRLREALHEINIAIDLLPDSDWELWQRGLLNARLGRYSDAVRDKLAAAKIKPRKEASAYAALAEDGDRAGEPSVVEAALTAAEALPDGHRQAQMVRAELSFEHGNAAGATRILEDLASTHPGDPQVWYLLANARFIDQNYSAAASAYLHAIALARNDYPQAHYRAALALHHIGRDDEALAQCRLALKVSPRDRDALALADEIERHLEVSKSALP
ncbi:MAG TPA: tetratricopeptide repeat protein [Candidatus Binataceae bacterium]|nr:tetratricopeptide repeat protein [Candidatus Binataceae bacterium]